MLAVIYLLWFINRIGANNISNWNLGILTGSNSITWKSSRFIATIFPTYSDTVIVISHTMESEYCKFKARKQFPSNLNRQSINTQH